MASIVSQWWKVELWDFFVKFSFYPYFSTDCHSIKSTPVTCVEANQRALHVAKKWEASKHYAPEINKSWFTQNIFM